MRRSTKHQEGDIKTFRDFTGGVNYGVPQTEIADNELVKGMNVELDPESKRLRSRPRLGDAVLTFPDTIRKLWEQPESKMLYVVAGTKLYSIDNNAYQEVGTLTGILIPTLYYWDSKVYVASGGKLQKIVGTALVTLTNSPDCDIVYSRFGRLYVSREGQDYILGSSVGDSDSEDAWVEDSDNPMQAQSLEVAYKESGDIMAVVPLLSELAVFRTFGIYRVISEFPDWDVREVTKEYTAVNGECAVELGNTVVFLTSSGLRELAGVQDFGDINHSVFAPKVSEWLASNVDPRVAWIRNLRDRKQLIIKPNDLNIVMVYHYLTGGATFWQFDSPINDIIEIEDNVIVAQEASLYYAKREHSGDHGAAVYADVLMKKYRGFNDYLIKRVAIATQNVLPGDLTIGISGEPFTFPLNGDELIYDDDELIFLDNSLIWEEDVAESEERNVLRVKYFQLGLVSSADFVLDQIQLEMAVIGRG